MKRLSVIILTISIILAAACTPTEPPSAGDQELLEGFDPTGFAEAGLNTYFSNIESKTAKFTPSFQATKSGNASGNLSVKAEFTDFLYDGYSINGNFTYEIPVKNGYIAGYRLTTDSRSSVRDNASVEKEFSIVMGNTTFAPATGTVTEMEGKPSTSSAEAFAFLPSSDVTFTIGGETTSISDRQKHEKYTKDMMPEDLFHQYICTYMLNPIYWNHDMTSTPGIHYLYDSENTLTVTDKGMSLNLIEPMHFIYEAGSTTFSINTSGKLSVASETQTMSAENYSASAIITADGKNIPYLSSKIMNGTISIPGTGQPSGSITIGNHTYSGQEYADLYVLHFLYLNIYSWSDEHTPYTWSEPDANGKTTMGPSYSGKLEAIYSENGNEASLSEGIMELYGNKYTFSADFTLENGKTDKITALNFNGHPFSQEAVDYINTCYGFLSLFTAQP